MFLRYIPLNLSTIIIFIGVLVANLKKRLKKKTQIEKVQLFVPIRYGSKTRVQSGAATLCGKRQTEPPATPTAPSFQGPFP